MGIEAETVTDGILIPWEVDETRGTIWIMAHGRREAFDGNDVRLMQALPNFAAMGVRHRRQQQLLLEQAAAASAAAMANDLAHQIDNPLQGLANMLYLAAEEQEGFGDRELAGKMHEEFGRLTSLVKRLLELPNRKLDRHK